MPAWAQAALVGALASAAWLVHRPGVFATDSLTSWYEGHVGAFTSNQQPLLGVLWALFDRIGSGASSLILLSCLLFTVATYLILRRFAQPVAALATTAVVLILPPIFSQLTIINKETIGGNALLLGVALLMHQQRDRRWLLAAVGAIAAFAVLIRYQFAVAIAVVFVIACVQDAWRAPGRRLRAFAGTAFGLGVPLLAAAALVTVAIGTTNRVDWSGPFDTSRRWMLEFELAALLASRSNAALDVLAESGADVDAIRAYAVSRYTPDSNVPLFPMDKLFAPVATPELARQVAVLSEAQPGRILEHRLRAFAALLGLRDVCWPIQKRIITPAPDSAEGEFAATVGLARLQPALATTLYQSRYFPANTFLFRPIVYLAIALFCTAVTLVSRRLRSGQELLLLSASGPVYALSFVLMAPSCDFRYSYWPVITATISAAALALALLRSRGRAGSLGLTRRRP